MAHQSLYRKYRSQSFDEVVGQQHVTRTLQNALASGRVAHAYLFCGPRGTGKTSTARLLARALNCDSGPTSTPCGECEMCVGIMSGRALDVVEVDAASETGIDNVREVIINNSRYAPAEGRYKVYIIDEVHDLSRAAFDGLLKTLEEPPPHVVFVLATTEIHKVPATIVSRCQRFEFRRGSLDEVRSRVEYVAQQEGIEIEPAAATLISRAAQGGWRDALSLLEQVISYADSSVTARDVGLVLGAIEDETLAELARHIVDQNALLALRTLDSLLSEGKDIRQLLQNFADFVRDCLLKSLGSPGDPARPLVPLTPAVGMSILEYTARAERELRWNTQHRLVLELMILRMTAAGAEPGRRTEDVQSTEENVPAPRASSAAPSVPDPRDSSPSPVSEALDLAAIQAQWKPLLSRVGENSRMLRSLLESADPVSVSGDTLNLEFTKSYHYESMNKATARRAVESQLGQILGRPLRIMCRLREDPETRPTPRKSRKDIEPITDDDLRHLFPGWAIEEE